MGSIFVLDANGNVVVDSRAPAPPADNHAQADYFQVQTQSSITGPYLSRPWRAPNGEFLIAISRRLANPDGSFAGAVVGTLRLSYFHDMFSKIKLGNKDALALIRTDGSIIMRFPFAAAFIGQSLASSPIFNRTAAYQSGSFEHTAKIDGVDRLYVFQHIGENPLVLSYGTSLEAVYAGWRQRAWLIGSLMLAMGAINITLIVFLANALRRRTEAEQQLSILATTDSLTGLCNRRRLDEMFDIEWQRALRSQSPIALLMIDADNFKAYNDKFGHQAGDNVLVDIARCIKATARRATDINARYGGEEFAVLLPGVAVADAIDLAEKFARAWQISSRERTRKARHRTPRRSASEWHPSCLDPVRKAAISSMPPTRLFTKPSAKAEIAQFQRFLPLSVQQRKRSDARGFNPNRFTPVEWI